MVVMVFAVAVPMNVSASFTGPNIALDATASHSGGGSGVWGADRLNNGDKIGTYNDCWTAYGGGTNWNQLEWENPVTVGSMITYYTRYRNLNGYNMHSCDIEYWTGTTWQNILHYDDNDHDNHKRDAWIELPTPVTTTKLRMSNMLTYTTNGNIMIQEWEVFSGVTPPKDFKEDAITELEALLDIDTNDDDLEDAKHYLKQSLYYGFDGSEVKWLDDDHIDEEKGADVFQYEQEAVDKLIAYLENDENTAFDFEDEIWSILEKLYKADKLLAEIAIDDAEAANGDSDKIDEAKDFLAEAIDYWDTEDMEEIADNAFDFLQKAWEKAVESW
jgi:hypothetical protein